MTDSRQAGEAAVALWAYACFRLGLGVAMK